MSDYKPGDKIIVTVDGEPFETIIDEQGVQRFPKDQAIIDSIPKVWDGYCQEYILAMNEMARRYQSGEISKRDYMLLNMGVGYSVCGFCELSSFDDLRLINPVWGETKDDLPGDAYLLANLVNHKFALSQVIEIIKERDDLSQEEAERHIVDEWMYKW